MVEHKVKVETHRSGPFTFQVGVDQAAVEAFLLRIGDAQDRFVGSPLSTVAEQLEDEVVVSSIFGTNSIEGGTLTEEETRAVVSLSPDEIASYEQQRVKNIKAAYDYSKRCAIEPNWLLDEAFILHVHRLVTDSLPHEHNRPAVIRNNPKGLVTRVGDEAHGGVYKPPQCEEDIQALLGAMIKWHKELQLQGVPALIRAPLVHYYYELIHPFWDGNGRVGRVIEATILQQEGFQYAPFAQAGYYFQHIHRYFALFNHGRKAAAKKETTPNTEFVLFFLQGILTSIHKLHDRVNILVGLVLFDNRVQHMHEAKLLNDRQYAIVTQLLAIGPHTVQELRAMPWYLALYTKLTDKTRSRDIIKLKDLGVLRQNEKGQLWPNVAM